MTTSSTIPESNAPTPSQPSPEVVDALRAAVHQDFDRTVSALIELAKIPGIAWAAFDQAQLDRSAEAVAALIREVGVDEVQILRENKNDGTPGGPAVGTSSCPVAGVASTRSREARANHSRRKRQTIACVARGSALMNPVSSRTRTTRLPFGTSVRR